jgi:hypothetical protein
VRYIEPALTPGEWSGKDGVILGTGSPKMGHFIGVDGWMDGDLKMHVVGPTSWEWDSEDRHRVAAVALYGQPFGFTRHDAWLVRRATQEVSDTMHPGALRYINELRGLADRIEALLPPEKT